MGANGIGSAQIWLDGLAGDFKRPVASYLRLQTYSQEGRAECQHQYPETVDEANESIRNCRRAAALTMNGLVGVGDLADGRDTGHCECFE